MATTFEFSMIDTYPYEIPSGVTEEEQAVLDWVRENISGELGEFNIPSGGPLSLTFHEDRDAVLFKLRWCAECDIRRVTETMAEDRRC